MTDETQRLAGDLRNIAGHRLINIAHAELTQVVKSAACFVSLWAVYKERDTGHRIASQLGRVLNAQRLLRDELQELVNRLGEKR